MSEGPLPPAIRISDAERQHAIAILRDAVVEGRLTLEEYSDRVGSAFAARTDQDIAVLTRDLPQQRRSIVPSSGAPVAHRAIFSHIIRRGPLSLERQSAFSSVFGTIDLDLREATLPGADVELDVHNIFGTVTVFVPEGVDVQIEGGGVMSSEKVDVASTRALVPGAPVIRIRVSGFGGTVYVRSQEARGWLDGFR
jgi:hypothetical protein